MDIQLIEENKKTYLVIKAEVPPPKKLPKSGSGKSLLLATTQGNLKTDLKYDGKVVVVGLNAYIAAAGE